MFVCKCLNRILGRIGEEGLLLASNGCLCCGQLVCEVGDPGISVADGGVRSICPRWHLGFRLARLEIGP